MCSLFLNRVFRLHVQFLCHLVAIISKQIVIQRLIIAGNGTTDGLAWVVKMVATSGTASCT